MTDALVWIAVGALTSPIWGTLLWHLSDLYIRPRFIPAEEIEKLVQQMLQQENPLEEVHLREYSAWHRGETIEQGKWRRVAKELRLNRSSPRPPERREGGQSRDGKKG